MAATRSYSARVMVCPRELVESSTMYVDRVLRESTRALTFTFPNSVSVALGIFSVSSRNRAAVGFHSTREPFTWYATVFPPPGHTRHARGHAHAGTLAGARGRALGGPARFREYYPESERLLRSDSAGLPAASVSAGRRLPYLLAGGFRICSPAASVSARLRLPFRLPPERRLF